MRILKSRKPISIMMTFIMVISSSFVLSSTVPVSAKTYIQALGKIDAEGGAIMRSQANTKSKEVMKLDDNKTIAINKEIFKTKKSTNKVNRWYYISVGSKNGYVRADCVDNIDYAEAPSKVKYRTNCRVGAGTDMKKLGVIKKGTKCNVIMMARAKDSDVVWYKLKANNEIYYVSSRAVKLGTVSPTIKVSDVTYPENLGEGLPFTLKGTIESTCVMTKVKFGVLDSDGKWIISTTKDVNNVKFDINDIDSKINFGSLKPGNYTYKGIVYIGDKSYTKVEYSFKIRKLTGPEKITNAAIALAWPQGTSKSSYAFSGGKPTTAFKNALDKYYPEHTKWGTGPKTGASCDVFVGTVIRYSGYDKDMPRGLGDSTVGDWYHLNKSSKWQEIPYDYKESQLKSGDVIIYKRPGGGHIMIYCKKNGKSFLAEASYKSTYGHINTSISKILKVGNKTKIAVYRATS